MDLELLQRHDLLLQGVPSDQAVDIHHFLLSNPVGSVHRLQVLHGVPVVFDEDDGVRPGEVEAQPAHAGAEKQEVNAGVSVELGHNGVALVGRHRPVQSEVAHGG